MTYSDQSASLGAALFSSQKMNWCTPPELFERCNAIWSFTLDAAASDGNKLCKWHFTERNSAFDNSWAGHRVWINPPYGRTLGSWVELANQWFEGGECPVIVMLIPSRTDTLWWHAAMEGGAKAHHIKGRLRFEGASSTAPFPSSLLIWERLP